MPPVLFDDLTDVYEAMIDWPKRLAHEGAFYRRVFERRGVRSVVDVACGTGRHAELFHQWRLHVEGADQSAAMIERARNRCGEPAALRWTVRGFDQLVGLPGSFDAAICVGNSLALAPDTAIAQRAVQQMLAAVRAGGAVVVHALNLWALPDGPCVWQKCRRATLPQGEVLIVKGVHRCGTRGFVELLVASSAGEPQLQTDSVPFLGLEASDLEHWARDAGACRVAVYDGYQEQPYQRELSADLLVLAEK